MCLAQFVITVPGMGAGRPLSPTAAVLPSMAGSPTLRILQHGPFRGGGPPSQRQLWARDVPATIPVSPLSLFLSRVESLEALPILSRNPSRSTDRDWETASAASSLASVAEYTGDGLLPPRVPGNGPGVRTAPGLRRVSWVLWNVPLGNLTVFCFCLFHVKGAGIRKARQCLIM